MDHEALIELLSETRRILALPGNDFAWSGWANQAEALAEIDDFLRGLAARDAIEPVSLKVLFAATGPVCEVSLSSGWADRFLSLGARFDRAIGDE